MILFLFIKLSFKMDFNWIDILILLSKTFFFKINLYILSIQNEIID